MSESQSIMLTSGVLIVRKINRKTTAKMFRNLKIGDRIELSTSVSRVGSYANGRARPAYITAINLATNEINTSTFNQLSNILNAFEFEVE